MSTTEFLSTHGVFWLGATGLCLLALAILLPAVLGRPRGSAASRASGFAAGTADPRQAALNVLREELRHLDEERAAGRLSVQDHAQACAELEQRVLDEVATGVPGDSAAGTRRSSRLTAQTPSWRTALSLLLGLPLLAVALYGHTGAPQALDASQPASALETLTAQSQADGILGMVDALEQRLQARPDDGEGWLLLGRSLAAMELYEPASQAYARAHQHLPPDAQRLADHADVLAMSQGRSARGEPTRLIDQALALDPHNLKALALAGSAAVERAEWATARTHWERARSLTHAEHPMRPWLEGQLNRLHSVQADTPSSPR